MFFFWKLGGTTTLTQDNMIITETRPERFPTPLWPIVVIFGNFPPFSQAHAHALSFNHVHQVLFPALVEFVFYGGLAYAKFGLHLGASLKIAARVSGALWPIYDLRSDAMSHRHRAATSWPPINAHGSLPKGASSVALHKRKGVTAHPCSRHAQGSLPMQSSRPITCLTWLLVCIHVRYDLLPYASIAGLEHIAWTYFESESPTTLSSLQWA